MPAENVRFERSIAIRHSVDVFVAGGGPSGIAAALAAARQGCSVYVAESHSCFGGMGTAGRLAHFHHFGDGVNFVASGIGSDVYRRLKDQTPRLYEDNVHRTVGIDAEVLKRVYDDLMVESGARFTFSTDLIAVDAENGHVKYAICASKSGIFAVKAKVFVDGTGDGDLAAWAGASFEQGDEHGNLQPGSLLSIWTAIDWDVVASQHVSQDAHLHQAFADGVFTNHDLHLCGLFRTGENIGTGNLVHTFDLDATGEESITKALLWGRKGQLEYKTYFTKYFQGYENMALVHTASLLGVRETRRIIGDYVLNVHDFEQQSVFDDEIGRFNYPVDVHPYRPDEKLYAAFEEEFMVRLRYKNGESYGIPYRVLTPRGLDNVLVAGRCVSSDRYINGSIRVMPGCFITGQAAGVAAALAGEQNVSLHALDVRDLQQRLRKLGAFLPNARV